MPQLFRVLRCYQCLVFQGHQVKKVSKFQCKACGEKQSMKKFYGVGNGQECRKHVQKLNEKFGISYEVSDKSSSDSEQEPKHWKTAKGKIVTSSHSKWSNYIDQDETVTSNDNVDSIDYFGGKELVLEVPKKKRKVFNSNKSNTQPMENANNYLHADTNAKKHYQVATEDNKSEMSDSKLSNNQALAINSESALSPNERVKKFVPPTINKQSKWAQYSENCSSHEEECGADSENVPNINFVEIIKQTKTTDNSKPSLYDMFSLCDDSDLDNIFQL